MENNLQFRFDKSKGSLDPIKRLCYSNRYHFNGRVALMMTQQYSKALEMAKLHIQVEMMMGNLSSPSSSELLLVLSHELVFFNFIF